MMQMILHQQELDLKTNRYVIRLIKILQDVPKL